MMDNEAKRLAEKAVVKAKNYSYKTTSVLSII